MDESIQSAGTGRVIVFSGLGKGKTTAALGAALRAIAYLAMVIFVCFTGPQFPELGEVKASTALRHSLRMIGIKSEAGHASYLDGFTESVDTVADALAMAHNVWVQQCELMVLDDIGSQIEKGDVDVAQVLALIEDRPPNVSIILTGQALPKVIVGRADLVTEFVEVRHPLSTDIGPRKGIDF